MTAVSEPIYHTELIDGHEIEKPLPNKLHALIQRYLMLLLNRDLHSGLLALSELNVLPGQMAQDGRQGCLVPAIVVTTRAAAMKTALSPSRPFGLSRSSRPGKP
jgi:hypothetical protein